jgi:hypothetical protein
MPFVLPEELIQLRDPMQYDEPSPDDRRPRWSVMLEIQVAAGHCDSQRCPLQGRNLFRRGFARSRRHQARPYSVQAQDGLLVDTLNRNCWHAGLLGCRPDCLGVCSIRSVSFNERTHVFRMQQHHLVSETLELSCPPVRTTACFVPPVQVLSLPETGSAVYSGISGYKAPHFVRLPNIFETRPLGRLFSEAARTPFQWLLMCRGMDLSPGRQGAVIAEQYPPQLCFICLSYFFHYHYIYLTTLGTASSMRHHRQDILIDAHNLICVPTAEHRIFFKSARQPMLSTAPSSVRNTIEPPVARDGVATRSQRATIAAMVLPWSCVCPNLAEIERTQGSQCWRLVSFSRLAQKPSVSS